MTEAARSSGLAGSPEARIRHRTRTAARLVDLDDRGDAEAAKAASGERRGDVRGAPAERGDEPERESDGHRRRVATGRSAGGPVLHFGTRRLASLRRARRGRGDVAQLGEHRVRIAGVRGSSPLISTTSPDTIRVTRASSRHSRAGRRASESGRRWRRRPGRRIGRAPFVSSPPGAGWTLLGRT